jgi:hypothetical protein
LLKKTLNKIFWQFLAHNSFWVHFVTWVCLHFWNQQKILHFLIPIMRGFEIKILGPLSCAWAHFYGRFRKRPVEPNNFLNIFAGFTCKWNNKSCGSVMFILDPRSGSKHFLVSRIRICQSFIPDPGSDPDPSNKRREK